MPRPVLRFYERPRLRLALIGAGLLVAALSLGVAAFSFGLADAYHRQHPLARAAVHSIQDGPRALIYADYEHDLEDAAIRLMNLGIWGTLAGAALLGLGLARPRLTQTP